jgi:allophycocyanin alpha subunit
MSIVTKSIVNADAEARYLSPGELDRIKSFVVSGGCYSFDTQACFYQV